MGRFTALLDPGGAAALGRGTALCCWAGGCSLLLGVGGDMPPWRLGGTGPCCLLAGVYCFLAPSSGCLGECSVANL